MPFQISLSKNFKNLDRFEWELWQNTYMKTIFSIVSREIYILHSPYCQKHNHNRSFDRLTRDSSHFNGIKCFSHEWLKNVFVFFNFPDLSKIIHPEIYMIWVNHFRNNNRS